jgi:hypothetical protein
MIDNRVCMDVNILWFHINRIMVLAINQINTYYLLGFSSKLNSLERGESFHLAKSCPFSVKICRSNSLRSSANSYVETLKRIMGVWF